MALTQVRVKLGETWTVLTYNAATGRYEGQLTPPGTSIHQPGGYFSLEVEATNASGDKASISGTQMPSLRLVVRETTAPTLSLLSPAPGYLTNQTPAFVFEATDETGGSGVNPDTFSLSGAAAQAISGGYRFTWTPPGGWADGAHTITVSVRDYDGNESTVSGAYIVDTVPPGLRLSKPDQRHVVDDTHVTVSGEAWDVTTPDVTVTVGGQAAAVAEDGTFSIQVPLAIGINRIPVVASDGAGNRTFAEVYMIRMVTDRSQADVDRLTKLYQRHMAEWTPEELEWFAGAACLRGSYDASDWNRVGAAVAWLAGELERRGYLAPVSPKTDWTEADAPTRGQMDVYLSNVETVRGVQGIPMPEIPSTMRHSSIDGWNRIERALVETDAVFHKYTAWTSGEVTCGGA